MDNSYPPLVATGDYPPVAPDYPPPVANYAPPTAPNSTFPATTPMPDDEFAQKYQNRRWGDMLAGKITTTPADLTQMQSSGRFRPDQLERMQTESNLRQQFANEQAQTLSQKAGAVAQGVGTAAKDILGNLTDWGQGQNNGGFFGYLGRLGESAGQGTYNAASSIGNLALKSITGPAQYLSQAVGTPSDPEADYQAWRTAKINAGGVPGYSPAPTASPVQTAGADIANYLAHVTGAGGADITPAQVPAPMAGPTTATDLLLENEALGGAGKLAEKAIPGIANATGLAESAPSLVARMTPGATGRAMRLQNAMNDALATGEASTAPGLAATAANLTGKATSAVGGGMQALGNIPSKVTSWLTEKTLGSPAAGDAAASWLKKGGLAGDILAVTAAGAMPGPVTTTLALIRGLERFGDLGERLSNVGDFLSRVAEADPNSPFGHFLTLAADKTAPAWMKTLAAAPITQLGLRAGRFAGGVATGAAKGAAAGGALGVISGDNPQEIGSDIAGMGLFGALHGGLGAKDAKIFNSHLGSVGEFVGKAIQNGTPPETLRLVPADAILNASIMSKIKPDVRTLFTTPFEPGSPSAPGGVMEGKAGMWDRANRTAWADATSRRTIMNTLLHEWFHPIYEEMVAQQPDIKGKLDSALAQDGKTIDDFAQQYAAKTGLAVGQFDPYAELLSEAAQHHLYGADLVQAAEGKHAAASATEAALGGLKGWLSDLGVGLAENARGEVFPDFRGTLDSPALRDLTTSLLHGQRQLQMGKPVVETKGTPVDNNYVKSMQFWQTPDGRNINPYGELVPDAKGGQRFVKAPASVLRQRAKTQDQAFQKYFQVGVPVKDVPQQFFDDPDIMPWTKDAVRQAVDAIRQGKGMEFYNHQLNGETSATSNKSWAQDARATLGNTEARLMRGTLDSIELTKHGKLILHLASESAIDAKLDKWANQTGPISLDLWGGDPGKVEPDLRQYLQNHAAGLPGETGIGQQKRDVLNAMLFGDNKEFQASNPLRPQLRGPDRKAIWRSPRLDRMESPQLYDTSRAPAQWEAGKRNFSPEPTDAAEYARLQEKMKEGFGAPDFMATWAKMEEIKNRNLGYAPGTGPHENPGQLHATQFSPSPEPGAIKSAAVRDNETGKVYEGPFHAEALQKYIDEKYPDAPHRIWAMNVEDTNPNIEDGFTTNKDEFLNRSQAYDRAVKLKQYEPEPGRGTPKLESFALKASRLKNPDVNPLQFSANPDPNAIKSAAVRDKETGRIYPGSSHVGAAAKSVKAGEDLEEGYITNNGEFLTRDKAMERAVAMKQYTPQEDDYYWRKGKPAGMIQLVSERFNKQNPGAAAAGNYAPIIEPGGKPAKTAKVKAPPLPPETPGNPFPTGWPAPVEGPKPTKGKFSAQPEEKEAGFYSQLGRVVDEKFSGEQMPAAQLSALLKNPSNGVKADELKWSGLDDFLKGKQRVSKRDVQEFLRNNNLTPIEHIKRAAEEPEWQESETGDGEPMWNWVNPSTGEQTADRIMILKNPGGEDGEYDVYARSHMSGSFKGSFKTLDEAKEYAISYKSEGEEEGETAYKKYTLPGPKSNYREVLFQLPESAGASFKSPHWDEPNIVAHARVDDRYSTDGHPGLFAEELQSDWHQEGRKEGYLDDSTTGVPNAPFKTTWQETVFRRLVQMAAQENKDWLGWTNGKQQAARYSLEKHVVGIQWDEESGDLNARTPGNRAFNTVARGVTKEKLPDYIGKEVANRLVNETPEENGLRVLTGVNLKVGGEGMAGFYDKILVDYANKFGKKFGARTSTIGLPGNLEEGDQVHVLPITPAMKASVLKGVPLFSPAPEEGGLTASAPGAKVPGMNEKLKYPMEMAPGKASGILPGILTAPYGIKLAYQRDMLKAMQPLFEAFSVKPGSLTKGTYKNSAGEVEHNPVTNFEVPAERAKLFGLLHGYFANQEAVAAGFTETSPGNFEPNSPHSFYESPDAGKTWADKVNETLEGQGLLAALEPRIGPAVKAVNEKWTKKLEARNEAH